MLKQNKPSLVTFDYWKYTCKRMLIGIDIFQYSVAEFRRKLNYDINIVKGFYFTLIIHGTQLVNVIQSKSHEDVYIAGNSFDNPNYKFYSNPTEHEDLYKQLDQFTIVVLAYPNVFDSAKLDVVIPVFWSLVNIWFFLSPFFKPVIQIDTFMFPANMRFLQVHMTHEPVMLNVNFRYYFFNRAYYNVGPQQSTLPNIPVLRDDINLSLNAFNDPESESESESNELIVYSPASWAISCYGTAFEVYPGFDHVSMICTVDSLIYQFSVFIINKNQVIMSAALVWWGREYNGDIYVGIFKQYNASCQYYFDGVSTMDNRLLHNKGHGTQLNQAEANIYQLMTQNQQTYTDK